MRDFLTGFDSGISAVVRTTRLVTPTWILVAAVLLSTCSSASTVVRPPKTEISALLSDLDGQDLSIVVSGSTGATLGRITYRHDGAADLTTGGRVTASIRDRKIVRFNTFTQRCDSVQLRGASIAEVLPFQDERFEISNELRGADGGRNIEGFFVNQHGYRIAARMTVTQAGIVDVDVPTTGPEISRRSYQLNHLAEIPEIALPPECHGEFR